MPPPPPPLRIGYVPEHFSTPLHFAATHFSLPATLIPYPSGTGHMIASLQAREIDVGIGLTEGWVVGLGRAQAEHKEGGFRLVGTYVETPLCWGVSTGGGREDIGEGVGGKGRGVEGLRGRKMGVSRVGSGSYVMGFVLADREGWLDKEGTPFEVVPLQTFEKLRDAVNNGSADFFMWEHFTSKRYFEEHQDEAVRYISSELDYSAEDAREWLKTVEFARDVRGVRGSVVEETVEVLKKAGVLGEVEVEGMIGIRKRE